MYFEDQEFTGRDEDEKGNMMSKVIDGERTFEDKGRKGSEGIVR